MKRLQITVLVVFVLVGYAVASASAAAPRARLRSLVCQKALDPPARAVSITAVMRPLPGTQKLEMKFELLSRPRGAPAFSHLSGTGLGTWIAPDKPTLGQRPGDVWIVHHPVADLIAPAAYHFRVGFRWLGTHGRILGTATKISASCWQPELRPDPLVQSFTAQPVAGRPKLDAYVAVIRNAGATVAGPFDVLFSFRPNGPVTIKRLGPHQTRRLQLLGPICDSTAPASLSVDSLLQVDDLNRANNTAMAVCP